MCRCVSTQAPPAGCECPVAAARTERVSGTPLVETTVRTGLDIANWANLHRKCNARGPMDKASAYGAEDSRFDPWRACKLPNALFQTDGCPVSTKALFAHHQLHLLQTSRWPADAGSGCFYLWAHHGACFCIAPKQVE